jgi:hypothetical protein
MAQQPIAGQGLLIIEASRSHSDTPHSVGFLWTSDSPTPRTLPDSTQHSQETDIHASGGIRTRSPSKRTDADPRLRPRGHWDRQTGGTAARILSLGTRWSQRLSPRQVALPISQPCLPANSRQRYMKVPIVRGSSTRGPLNVFVPPPNNFSILSVESLIQINVK